MARIDVVMPKMGESVMEGTVLTWFKQPGEEVEADEALLEIGTDKVDTEIPSPAAGKLAEIRVPEGETVEVGTVLAVLETEAEVTGAGSESTEGPDAAHEPVPQTAVESHDDQEPEGQPEVEPVAEATPESTNGTPQLTETKTAETTNETGDAKGASEGVVEVVMPKMGESVMEGTVLNWFKQPGDEIETDEALLEIGTDKVDSEIPSPASGRIQEILVDEGETVEVGTLLARISSPDAPAAKPVSATPSPEPQAEPVDTSQSHLKEEPSPTQILPVALSGDGDGVESGRRGSDGRFYSPLVRSIAREEGISTNELAQISGSGRDGRVTKDDILSFITQKGKGVSGVAVEAQAQATAPTASTPTAAAPKPAPAPSQSPGTVATDDGRVEIIEMDRMRQVIAEHMPRSLATSAHVTSFAEADVTNLVRLRERSKKSFLEQEGVKLTYTPFFVKAAVDALRDHPLLNSSVDGTRIILKKDFHVGIAVAIEKTGLVVPVIRNAGGMNVAGLAHAAADLADRARSKQLQPDELQGGTFTVTNVGSLGSIMGTPIINQPQVAILATGAITKRPVVKEHPDYGDVVVIRSMVYLSLSYDHRIIDGAMGASFLRNVVANLEAIGPGYDL